MRKVLVFTLVVLAVTWIAEFAAEPFIKGNTALVTLMGCVYMFIPMIVAMTLQKISGEPFRSTGLLNLKVSWLWLLAFVFPVAAMFLMLPVASLFPGVEIHYGVQNLIHQLGLTGHQASMAEKQLGSMPASTMIGMGIVSAIFSGCTINAVVAFGEEYGWRNYMAHALRQENFLKAAAFIGVVWALWHMPLVLGGHNFPQHPVLGVLMMVPYCIFSGALQLYLVRRTGSVMPSVIMHGTINGLGQLPLLLLDGGDDIISGPAGLAASISSAIILLIVYLVDRKAFRTPDGDPGAVLEEGLQDGSKLAGEAFCNDSDK